MKRIFYIIILISTPGIAQMSHENEPATIGHKASELRDNIGNDSIYFFEPGSRFVIGGEANYLPKHKFVVKDGSAMIEGDIITGKNIGIGTSSFKDGEDLYRLSVEGKIRARAVKVYTDWADFVFDEGYDLPTLEEVEKFIKANGHLMDIPSAIEVESNGIELGEMNKLLLKKIEELTLYTIGLKKDFESLKSKLKIHAN